MDKPYTESQSTFYVQQHFSPENHGVREIMWNNIADWSRTHMAI
jgi:hypothetical protein